VSETGIEALRKTPLHGEHVALGARMVAFAGWHMPVQYSGVIDEHRAVRERAGLFDVSHMGEAIVRGPGALALVQHVTCNDAGKLAPGRAQYSALTTDSGGFVDDLLVYRTGEEEFLLVLNASNTAKDVAWIRRHAAAYDASIEDVSEAWALLALQGPLAERVLAPLVAEPLDGLRPFRFLVAEVAGAQSVVSRTGYTGEDGFVIYAPAEAASRLWRALLERGEAHGLLPAGLAARDTLRLEAALTLYGNDIDETTSVLEAGLGWIVKLDKGPFIGREALARQRERGLARKLAGFEMRGRGLARPGFAVLHDGREVGRVTSGGFAPTLERGIGLVYLPIALAEPGQPLEIDVRGRREPAQVVETPFYRRAR
jgi:aminomethyltransferase